MSPGCSVSTHGTKVGTDFCLTYLAPLPLHVFPVPVWTCCVFFFFVRLFLSPRILVIVALLVTKICQFYSLQLVLRLCCVGPRGSRVSQSHIQCLSMATKPGSVLLPTFVLKNIWLRCWDGDKIPHSDLTKLSHFQLKCSKSPASANDKGSNINPRCSWVKAVISFSLKSYATITKVGEANCSGKHKWVLLNPSTGTAK